MGGEEEEEETVAEIVQARIGQWMLMRRRLWRE